MTVKPHSGHGEILGVVLYNLFNSTLLVTQKDSVVVNYFLWAKTQRLRQIFHNCSSSVPLSAWWWQCIQIFHDTSDFDPNSQSTLICKHLSEHRKLSFSVCLIKNKYREGHLWRFEETIKKLQLLSHDFKVSLQTSDTPTAARPHLERWMCHSCQGRTTPLTAIWMTSFLQLNMNAKQCYTIFFVKNILDKW